MTATRRRWAGPLAALGCGLLAVLSQPPVSVPWILLGVLPVLFILWRGAERPRRAFLLGWAAGVGYFGAGLYWIAEAFLVDAETYAWMIPLALTGIAAGLALFWGAGFWLAARVAPGSALGFAACWMALEWLRGNVLTGFPWALFGYAWIDTPAMQIASAVGIYGVTLWTLVTGAALGAAVAARRSGPRLGWAGATAALLAGGWGTGAAITAPPPPPDPKAPKIGIVQPNIAQKDKWRADLREAHLNTLLTETAALLERGAEIVVWPEAATPYDIERSDWLRARIAAALQPEGMLLTGALRFEAPGTPGMRVFNSLIAVDTEGTVRAAYDKQHLVPFGEYLPFDETLTGLGLRALATLPGSLSAGEAPSRRMAVPGLPSLVPMICYEAIFPAEIMTRDDPAEWMVQVTNDAWFGRSAGPYQHLVQARVRAIERGLPLVRAANTGISAVIDSSGQVADSLPLNADGTLLQPLPPAGSRTYYSRFEDSSFALAILLILGAGMISVHRRAKSF